MISHFIVFNHLLKGKDKAIRIKVWTDLRGYSSMRLSGFLHFGTRRWQGCLLDTGRLYSQGNTHFCYMMSRPKGHSAT